MYKKCLTLKTASWKARLSLGVPPVPVCLLEMQAAMKNIDSVYLRETASFQHYH